MKAPKKFLSKFTKRKNENLAILQSTIPSQNDDPVGSHNASPSNNNDLASPQSAAPFNNDEPSDLNTFTSTVRAIKRITEAIGLPVLSAAIGGLSKVLESIKVRSSCMYLYSHIMCDS